MNASDTLAIDEQTPQLALIALATHKLAIRQFASVTLQWEAAIDFSEEFSQRQVYQLPEQPETMHPACIAFREFLILNSSSVPFPITDEDFKIVIERLCNPKVPASERQFSVLHFADLNTIVPILQEIVQLGFRLFMPIYDVSGMNLSGLQMGREGLSSMKAVGSAKDIVPSLTMIQTTIDVICGQSLELEPMIGPTSEDRVFESSCS